MRQAGTVDDRKPPRFAREERATLLALLQYHRDSVVRKVSGLDDDVARRTLVPSGTSLLWLVGHLASAEVTWVLRRFAGRDAAVPRDEGTDPGSLADAVASYRATWALVDGIVAAASLDDPCQGLDDGGPPANLRWVLTHLLEETARHAGHADILRELVDGQTGR